MVRRISHPNRPTILVDEGPGLALRHRYDLARRTLDIALPERRARHDREPVHLEQPAR
jgi:signal transduction histidine kinase